MRNILDLCIDKRIGEWFLFEHGIVIKFYGFVHPPYMFLDFLTPRVFYMEFIRQNIIKET